MALRGFDISPDEIVDRIRNAALAGGLSAVDSALTRAKAELKERAPVSGDKPLGNQGIRSGGRTRRSIGTGNFTGRRGVGRVFVRGEFVMAPQGFYINDGFSPATITAVRKKGMSFKWNHVNPAGPAGWAFFPSRTNQSGISIRASHLDSRTAYFNHQDTVVRKARPGTGWIDAVNNLATLNSYLNGVGQLGAEATFREVMRRKNFRARPSDVGDSASLYSGAPEAWASPYPSSDDDYRRRGLSEAQGSASSWNLLISRVLARG